MTPLQDSWHKSRRAFFPLRRCGIITLPPPNPLAQAPPRTSSLCCTSPERGASGSHISRKGALKQGRGLTFCIIFVFFCIIRMCWGFDSQKLNRKEQFSFQGSSQWLFFWATPQKNSKHISPLHFSSLKKDAPPLQPKVRNAVRWSVFL